MVIKLYWLLCFLLCQGICFLSNAFVDEAFFSSCRSGDVNKVQTYLESGISVHSKDAKFNTGLIIAAGRGQIEVVKLLLSHGANVEDATGSGIFEGKTALCWASSQGRTETVALLMQAGANPTTPASSGIFAGKNALMWAASQGRTEVVRFLLSANVPVDYSSDSGNFKGKTALMWASSQGRVEAVEALLEAGSNVNILDSDGLSALMWAAGSEAAHDDNHRKGLLEKATKGHVKVVQLLLQYGAEFDVRDKDGITAIMFASYHGHEGAVQTLINAGTNADFVNKAGKTALQLARGAGQRAVVDVILNGPNHMNATLNDLKDISTCGWLIHILRAPKGTGVVFDRNYLNSFYEPPISKRKSCQVLKEHDIDHSLYDLLEMVEVYGVESVVEHLGNLSYGAKGRARYQLQLLFDKHKKYT